MKTISIIILIILLTSSCTVKNEDEVIPAPVISFYEGRDFWNNPIYINRDTVLNGMIEKGVLAHFAAAGGIKRILVTKKNEILLDKLEDNEIDFNDEFLCAIKPKTLPDTIVINYSVEDWNGKTTNKTLTVLYK